MARQSFNSVHLTIHVIHATRPKNPNQSAVLNSDHLVALLKLSGCIERSVSMAFYKHWCDKSNSISHQYLNARRSLCLD
jgi:hypothetical protein